MPLPDPFRTTGFSLSGLPDPFRQNQRSFGLPDPFAGAAIPGTSPEPERGFLGSIVHGLARDVTGASKTALAAALAPLDFLGVNVPVSLDDLETRDLVGAALVASMFVGGLGVSVARSVAAGQGVKGAAILGRLVGGKAGQKAARSAVNEATRSVSAIRRAALTAGGEAGAGVFFGGVKPLEESENRLEAILSNSALFGTLGGAFSLVGSALKATIGVRIAELKGKTRAAQLAQGMQEERAKTALREFAGIRLKNPVDDAIIDVKRLATGEVAVTGRSGDAAFSGKFSNFNDALRTAFDQGYTDRLGITRSKLTLKNIQDLDEGIIQRVQEAGGDITQVIDDLDFRGYQAVQDILQRHNEQGRILSWLGAEDVIEATNEYGIPQVSLSFRRGVLNAVPKDTARKLSKLEDPSDFLRESIRAGAVDVENLHFGAEVRDFLTELAINQRTPKGLHYVAYQPFDVSFLAHLVSPSTLAKIHPEIHPLFQAADAAAQTQVLGSREALDFFNKLENTLPTTKMRQLAEMIDNSQQAGNVQQARDALFEAVAATGDDQLQEAAETIVTRLNEYRLRAVAAGRLGHSDAANVGEARAVIGNALKQADNAIAAEDLALQNAGQLQPVVRELLEDAGRAGYLPISFSGGIRMEVAGEISPRFFHTWNEALAAMADEGNDAFLMPAIAADAMTARTVKPAEFGRMVQAIREAEGFDITATEAAELLKETGTLPSIAPRKFSRFLKERKLGVREFADDPFTSLRFYMLNMERTLAFNDFERTARQAIDNIPDAKNQVKAWAEDYTNRMLGRPTRPDRSISNFFQGIAPGAVSPQTLHTYSLFARRVQSAAKLGGFWSGIVNSTQIAINTSAVIGARWTAEGLRGVLNKNTRNEMKRLLARHNVDLGLHTGLNRAGEVIGAESVTKEIRNAIARAQIGEGKKAVRASLEALENMWMFSFNGAEKVNRLTTFWGSYKRGLSEGMDEASAVAFATEKVKQTQFNYRPSDIPLALQGPIGSVLGQFKTFFIKEAELIASVDAKTRAKMMASFMAMGGAGSILALPGADLVDNAARFMFDMRLSDALKIQGAQAEERGEGLGGAVRFAAFGAPGLLNIDMTNHIGPGGFNEMLQGTNLLGPTSSDLKGWTQFFAGAIRDQLRFGRISEDTVNNWMQRVMPSQIRRFMRGQAIFETGEIRNPYSKKLIYRPDDRVRVASLQALGAPTVRMSVERAIDDFVDRKVAGYRDARESYRRQIGLAALQGETTEVVRLRRQALRAGISFDASDIQSAIQSFSRSAAERRARRTPVDIRDDLLDFYDIKR